jgi:predicted protein tyrosine phosphatase
VDEVLIQWADIIVFAAAEHHKVLKDSLEGKEVHVLNIPDMYQFRDPKLVEIVKEKLRNIGLIDV